MFSKGFLALTVVLALLSGLQAISTLSYTFPNSANDMVVNPGYPLGVLNAGFSLEIKFNIPGVTAPAVGLDALTIQIVDAVDPTIIVSAATGFNPATCAAGSVDCTLVWKVETSKQYVLKAFATNPQTAIEYFTISAVTYNSTMTNYVGSPNNVQVLQLTEVIRNQVVKLFYVSQQQKDLKFKLYPVPEALPAQTPAAPVAGYSLSIFFIGSQLPTNNFVFVNPDLLAAAAMVYNTTSLMMTYTISLTTVGYYAVVVNVPRTASSMSLGWVSDSYLCPYNQNYGDYYGNFQGCTRKAPSEGGLPCTSYNPITGICSACIDKYVLVNNTCLANTTCPDRQYYHFGSCLNVSTLCGGYDPWTGLCLTCAMPADYELINGTCVHKIVVCGVRQYQKNYICYNVDVGCGDYDAVTGNCINCAGFQYEFINGTCPVRNVVCPAGQYVLNFTCVTIPIECLNFDTVKGVCLACLRGYMIENGVCKRVPCPPGQVPSRFGIFCTNVSPLCENYDDITGRCLSCKSPNHRVNANGDCAQYTSPLAGCSERQRLGFGACIHAELNCYAYNLVTGNCDQCEKGFYLDYTGRCAKTPKCGEGQWSVNGDCVRFPENCARVNDIGLCTVCASAVYRLEYGICVYFQKCLENQYLNSGGQCVNVSEQCATFNPTDGLCITCKTPETTPTSGVCCPAGQINNQGACVDAVILQQSYQNSTGSSCLLVHPYLGNCLKCNPGYEPDQVIMNICVAI